ncbi:MAG: AMP-binding protein [Gemmatimonadaceae bacterium]|jgi:fatty-acyl-CoA synthase|nr:AMP-binding protein [Gemmatimonadaceae bacterium]
MAVHDVTRDRIWSYRALDAYASQWCDWLRLRGVQHGAFVAALAGNCIELMALYVACGRLGAALVPLNWRLAPRELDAIVDQVQPVVCLTDDRARSDPLATASQWTCFDDLVLPDPSMDVDAELPMLWPDHVAMVLYTSGSTGAPKGAMLTHGQVLANAIATVTGWQLAATDRVPIATPLFHTGGWHVFTTPLWWAGGSVVLLGGFDAERWLGVLEATACTVAFAVPTQLTMLLAANDWGRVLPRLKWIIAGGAACPTTLATRVRAAGYVLREGFGMTEFGPNCFCTSDAHTLPPGVVGWPVPFAELRLVDPEGRDVAHGEVGELWVRGPQRFAGYLRDPARTDEAITVDGWFRTGDLLSREPNGAYRVRGRRKEMFISGGENVFPAEVEAVLLEHPDIAEVAVLGIPDPMWGEVGCAVVTTRADLVVEADAVRAWARTRLAAYKVPKQIVQLPTLPRLGSGKIDRAVLATLVRREA